MPHEHLHELMAELASKHRCNPPATLDEVVRSERRLSIVFPSDFKRWLLFSNGAQIGFDEEFHEAQYDLMSLTRLSVLGNGWLRFCYVLDGNYAAIDPTTGHVYDLFHELPLSDAGQIASSFEEFLERALKSYDRLYWLYDGSGSDAAEEGSAEDSQRFDPYDWKSMSRYLKSDDEDSSGK